jgi:hypothetical protein
MYKKERERHKDRAEKERYIILASNYIAFVVMGCRWSCVATE